ncbi:NIC-domain-containing protein [Gonapodya prolifera JEL478]|uniref:NIC-domain-containing protein n=1 Tax=Gonapodya prolifera (strain JEL478) TaxID=1344416 RepID=A0A139AMA8_GONPJ|nr:NIC-domain-containing protein [Gonapodya prolifera JEL478]|eukprot:KXS17653.1 NIC-domain-containing protein [Gonapodya prolifera JEL478]
MATWSDLQKQSQKLTNHISDASAPIPTLNRDLSQIEALSRNLRARTGRPQSADTQQQQNVPLLPWGASTLPSQPTQPVQLPPPQSSSLDPRTTSLLSRAGIDPQRTSQLIASIRLAQSYEPAAPVADTDLDAFLAHQHENVILRALEERKARTAKDYEAEMDKALWREWGEARKRIFEEIEDGMRGYNARAFGSASDTAMDIQEDNLHARLTVYAKSIRLLNESRLLHTPFPILSSLETALDSTKPKNPLLAGLVRSFRILATVLGERDSSPPGPPATAPPDSPRELVHIAALRAQDDSPAATSFRRLISRRSRSLLEAEYADHMQRTVAQNPRAAAVGGIPGPAEVARGYVNVVHGRGGGVAGGMAQGGQWDRALEVVRHRTMGEVPVWAVMFYLVRSGKVEEAAKMATEVEGELSRTGDGSFPGYIRAWASGLARGEDGRFPKGLREAIRNDWDLRVRQIVNHAAGAAEVPGGYGGNGRSTPGPAPASLAFVGDLFKYALYKLVGRLDLRTPYIPRVPPFENSVVRTAEDFLWVQLVLAQERAPSDEPQSERFSLRSVAAYYTQKAHKYASPVTYLNLLLLCGEFERAVEYLRAQEGGLARVEAVQMACACAYYGALRVPEDPTGAEPGIFVEKHARDASPGHGGGGSMPRRASTMSFGAAPGSPTAGGGGNPGGAAGGVSGYAVATLNFARLVQQHVRMFGRSAPEEAVQYLCLVALYGEPLREGGPGQPYTRLAHRLVSDLVLESREFARLLGSVRADGTVQPGELERFAPLLRIEHGEFVKRVTREAAERVVRTGGQWKDAVLLYYLAGEHGKVMDAVVKKLGEVVGKRMGAIVDGSVGSGAPAVGSEEARYAEDLLGFYDRTPSLRIDDQARKTAGVLLTLLRFTEEYERGRFDSALETLKSTRLLPLENSDPATALQRAQNAAFLDDSIARNLPEIVMAGVDCIARMWRALRESTYDNMASRQKMTELKANVDAVVMYLGKVVLKMPRDTYARIIAVQTGMI